MSLSDSYKKVIALGKHFTDALAKKNQRVESDAVSNSSLPEEGYDFWRGDLSLINPTSSNLDSAISDICLNYAKRDKRERSKLRRSISMDQCYTLIAFGRRMAVFACRESKIDIVVSGLTAIAMIKSSRVDFRDIIWCLALLYHAAIKVDGRAEELFHTAAEIAEPKVAGMFLNFFKQPPSYRKIRESWGYDEVETEDGFGFIGWGSSDYNPTVDLKSLVIDLSNLIANDSYYPSHIKIATELPDAWLSEKDNATRESMLSKVRAGASFHADLRQSNGEKDPHQLFLLFLLELKNEEDAQSLYQLAVRNKPRDFHKLAIVRDRLFCSVIAR